MKTALLVIDVQKYFVSEKTKGKALRALPGKIARFIEKNRFDQVLFTIHVNKKDSSLFKLLDWRRCLSRADTEMHDSLKKFANRENVFEKSTYSAFKSRKLLDFLRKKRIEKIFLCGIETDACILASAYDAFDLGFNAAVLKDLCASSYGSKMHGCASKIMEKNLEK